MGYQRRVHGIRDGAKKWLLSCNHKDIGTLYLVLGIWSGIVGTSLRIVIRVELVQPGAFLGSDQIYNVLVFTTSFNSAFNKLSSRKWCRDRVNRLSALKGKHFSQGGGCGFCNLLSSLSWGIFSFGGNQFYYHYRKPSGTRFVSRPDTYIPLSCLNYCYPFTAIFTSASRCYYYTTHRSKF